MIYRLLVTISLSLQLSASQVMPTAAPASTADPELDLKTMATLGANPPSPAFGTSLAQSPELDSQQPVNPPSARDTTESHAETEQKTSSARGATAPLPGLVPHTEAELTPAPSVRTTSKSNPAHHYQATRQKLLAAKNDLAVAQDVPSRVDATSRINKLFITCAGRGYADLVELAIRAGVNINVQDMNGYTAIHAAIQRLPHPNLIITTPASHNRNSEEYTSGHHSVISTLLAHHADLTLPARTGITPIQSAIDQEQVEVIYLFAKAGLVQMATFPQGAARGRLARRESFDTPTVEAFVNHQIGKAADLGTQAHRADDQNWNQQALVIAAALPALHKDLIPLIQKYAGLPPVSFNAVEIIKQIQQPDKVKKCCCTVS